MGLGAEIVGEGSGGVGLGGGLKQVNAGRDFGEKALPHHG
jgi:hypothetical protein